MSNLLTNKEGLYGAKVWHRGGGDVRGKDRRFCALMSDVIFPRTSNLQNNITKTLFRCHEPRRRDTE